MHNGTFGHKLRSNRRHFRHLCPFPSSSFCHFSGDFDWPLDGTDEANHGETIPHGLDIWSNAWPILWEISV
jgi:hypothetical protein